MSPRAALVLPSSSATGPATIGADVAPTRLGLASMVFSVLFALLGLASWPNWAMCEGGGATEAHAVQASGGEAFDTTTAPAALVGTAMVLSAERTPSDSTKAAVLTLPETGIFYVRYGAPGGVRLHRGNLAPWRGRIRAALDSLALATEATRGGHLADRGPADSTGVSLLSVLDRFAQEKQDLDGIHERDAGSAIAGSDVKVGAPSKRGASPLVSQPVLGTEVIREERGAAAVAGSATGAPFTDRTETSPPVPPEDAVSSAGETRVVLVPTPPIVTSAEPETLRVALLERRIVQTQAILFETARAEILPGAEPILEGIASLLGEEPEIRLEVEGHTDVRGSEAYNQELSERRANAIRSWLLDRGIAPDRVIAIGLGESRPFDPRQTVEAHALNRRVVFRVLP